MSLYNSIVDALKKEQKESEQAFSEYIDTSIKLKKSLNSAEEENETRWNTMQKKVSEFDETPIGSDDPGDLLETNKEYQQQMEPVSITFSAEHRQALLERYQTTQATDLKAAEDYIDKQSE